MADIVTSQKNVFAKFNKVEVHFLVVKNAYPTKRTPQPHHTLVRINLATLTNV